MDDYFLGDMFAGQKVAVDLVQNNIQTNLGWVCKSEGIMVKDMYKSN